MPENKGYAKEIYDYLGTLDNNYHNDVSFGKFTESMKDKSYAKDIHDWIGGKDESFTKDVPFDSFYKSVNESEKKNSTPQGQGILKSGFGESVSGGTKADFGSTTITEEQANNAESNVKRVKTKENPLALTDEELRKPKPIMDLSVGEKLKKEQEDNITSQDALNLHNTQLKDVLEHDENYFKNKNYKTDLSNIISEIISSDKNKGVYFDKKGAAIIDNVSKLVDGIAERAKKEQGVEISPLDKQKIILDAVASAKSKDVQLQAHQYADLETKQKYGVSISDFTDLTEKVADPTSKTGYKTIVVKEGIFSKMNKDYTNFSVQKNKELKTLYKKANTDVNAEIQPEIQQYKGEIEQQSNLLNNRIKEEFDAQVSQIGTEIQGKYQQLVSSGQMDAQTANAQSQAEYQKAQEDLQVGLQSKYKGDFDKLTSDVENKNKQFQLKYNKLYNQKTKSATEGANRELDLKLKELKSQYKVHDNILETYKKEYGVAYNKLTIDKNAKELASFRNLPTENKLAISFASGIGNLLSSTGGAMGWMGFENASLTLNKLAQQNAENAGVPAIQYNDLTFLSDPDWWIVNSVQSMPLMLATMPLSFGMGAAGGWMAKLAQAGTIDGEIAAALGEQTLTQEVASVAAGGFAGWASETMLEAGDSFSSAINEGKTKEEAAQIASATFKRDLATLPLSIAQMLPIFGKGFKFLETAGVETASNYLEEIAQGWAQTKSKAEQEGVDVSFGDYFFSSEAQQAGAAGAICGNLYTLAAFKKTDNKEKQLNSILNSITVGGASQARTQLEILKNNSVITKEEFVKANRLVGYTLKAIDKVSNININDDTKVALIGKFAEIEKFKELTTDNPQDLASQAAKEIIAEKEKEIKSILKGETPIYLVHPKGYEVPMVVTKDVALEIAKSNNASDFRIMVYNDDATQIQLDKINEKNLKAEPIEEKKVEPTTPSPTTSVSSDKKADIERIRQEELEKTITNENDLMVLAKVKEKNDPARTKREVARMASKTSEGNNLLEKHKAEDDVDNLSKSLNERVSAGLFLEGNNPTHNDSGVSDIQKSISKLITDIESGRTHLLEKEKSLYAETIKQLRKGNKQDNALANKLEAIQSATSPLKGDSFGVYNGEKISGKTKQEVIEKINAKYDAELAALETPKAGSVGVGGDVINAKERTEWNGYRIGDVISDSELMKNSGGNYSGKKGEKYVLVQEKLSNLDGNRQDLYDQNDGYKKEEDERLENLKKDFNKTPPIPESEDGLHRIVAAKELGHETILMWKPLKAVEQSLKETPKAEPAEPQKTDKDYQQAQEINTRISKEHPNASVLIQPKGEDLSLTAIYVGKNNRGKGIGSKVLESVKSEADKVGKKVVLDATNELDKETDIKRLGEFYEKNGFKKVGENKFEYEPKIQVEPITPKEGDIVELQPRVKGGMKPQAVFKDGKWQAKVGKETSEIGKAAQEEAQTAFESSNKPTLEPKNEVNGGEKQQTPEIIPEEVHTPIVSRLGKMGFAIKSLAGDSWHSAVELAKKGDAKFMSFGGYEKTGFEETKEYKDLVKSGHIVENFNILGIKGRPVYITSPDNMMVGDIHFGDTHVIKGEGGVHFVSKTGHVWAFKKGANTMVKFINEEIKKNGSANIVLTKGGLGKTLNTHEGAIGAMRVLEDLTSKGYISLDRFKNALTAVGVKYNIKFSDNGDIKSIHESIKKGFYERGDSTFENRGTFIRDFVKEITSGIKRDKKSDIEAIKKALNTDRTLGKDITLNRDNVIDAIGGLFSDEMTLDVPIGYAYAVIQVSSEVKPVNIDKTEGGHAAYPEHVVTIDGSRPKLLIIDKPQYIGDIANDINNNVVVNKKDVKGNVKYPHQQLGSNNTGFAEGVMKTAFTNKGKGEKGTDLIESGGKRKQMTEDDKGNYLFFHYSKTKFNKLNPNKIGTHLATGRDERTATPVSSLYTRPDVGEANVPNDFGYVVRVPKDKVYDFNSDPLNLKKEAEARFKKENPNRAFDANNKLAEVAKLAAEKGFQVTVADWNIKGTKTLIAKTSESLPLENYNKRKQMNQVEFAKGMEDIKANAKRRDIKYNDVSVKYMTDANGNIFGFVKDGEITLNGDKKTANTPIHEAGHIWIGKVKEKNPELYKAGMDKVDGSKYLEDVKNEKLYQDEAAKLPEDMQEDYFKEEALAKAIGDNGEKFATDAKKSDFKTWVLSMWKAVAKEFGLHNMSPEEVSKLTLDEFSKKAAADILGGKGENAPENLKKLAEDNNLPSFRNVVNLVNKYVREVNLEEGKTITDAEVKQALKNKEEGVTREGWVSKTEKPKQSEPVVKKKRAAAKRFKEAGFSLPKELENYTPISNEEAAQTASDLIDSQDKDGKGVDYAINILTNANSLMSSDFAVALGTEAFRRLDEQFKKAKTEEEKQAIGKKQDIIYQQVITQATINARALQSMKEFWNSANPYRHVGEVQNAIDRLNQNKINEISTILKKFNVANLNAIDLAVNNITNKIINPKIEIHKRRLSTATIELKTAWNNFKTSGAMFDPKEEAKRQFAFDKALANVAKEFIIYKSVQFTDFLKHISSEIGSVINPADEKRFKDIFDTVKGKEFKKEIKLSLSEMQSSLKELAEEHYNGTSDIAKNLEEKIKEKFALEAKDATAIAIALKDEIRKIAVGEKIKALKSSSLKNNGWFNELIELSNEGALNTDEAIKAFGKKIGVAELTESQKNKLVELGKKIVDAENNVEKAKHIQDIEDLKSVIKKSVGAADLFIGTYLTNMFAGIGSNEANSLGNNIETAIYLGEQLMNAAMKGSLSDMQLAFKALSNGYRMGYGHTKEMLKTGRTPQRELSDISPRNMWETIMLKDKDSLNIIESALQAIFTFNPKGVPVGKALLYERRIWNRLLSSMDALSGTVNFELGIYEAAAKEADSKGLKGKARREFIIKKLGYDEGTKIEANKMADSLKLTGKERQKYIDLFIKESRPEELKNLGKQASGRATLTAAPSKVSALGKVSQMLNNTAKKHPSIKIAFPVVNTFTNLAIKNIERSPFEFLSLGIDIAFREPHMTEEQKAEFTPDEKIRRLKAAVYSTLVMGALFALAGGLDDKENGYFEIYGGGTGNINLDNQMRAIGWKPYTIKVGERYISYDVLTFGFMLGILGDIRDFAKYGNKTEAQELREKLAENLYDEDYTELSSVQKNNIESEIFSPKYNLEQKNELKVGKFLEKKTVSPLIYVSQLFGTLDNVLQIMKGDKPNAMERTGGGIVKTAIMPRYLGEAKEVFDNKLYDTKDFWVGATGNVPFVSFEDGVKLDAMGREITKYDREEGWRGIGDGLKYLATRRFLNPSRGTASDAFLIKNNITLNPPSNSLQLSYPDENYKQYIVRRGQILNELITGAINNNALNSTMGDKNIKTLIDEMVSHANHRASSEIDWSLQRVGAEDPKENKDTWSSEEDNLKHGETNK